MGLASQPNADGMVLTHGSTGSNGYLAALGLDAVEQLPVGVAGGGDTSRHRASFRTRRAPPVNHDEEGPDERSPPRRIRGVIAIGIAALVVATAVEPAM